MREPRGRKQPDGFGRQRSITKHLHGNTTSNVRDQFEHALGILSYWRDAAGHGVASLSRLTKPHLDCCDWRGFLNRRPSRSPPFFNPKPATPPRIAFHRSDIARSHIGQLASSPLPKPCAMGLVNTMALWLALVRFVGAYSIFEDDCSGCASRLRDEAVFDRPAGCSIHWPVRWRCRCRRRLSEKHSDMTRQISARLMAIYGSVASMAGSGP